MKYRLKFKLFQYYIYTVVLSKWVVLKVFLCITISTLVTDAGDASQWQSPTCKNCVARISILNRRDAYEESHNEILRRVGRIYNWHLFWENKRLCKKSISNFGRDEHTLKTFKVVSWDPQTARTNVEVLEALIVLRNICSPPLSTQISLMIWLWSSLMRTCMQTLPKHEKRWRKGLWNSYKSWSSVSIQKFWSRNQAIFYTTSTGRIQRDCTSTRNYSRRSYWSSHYDWRI